MMSSAIPARLEFQCGHAALVTLPRIKGESAAQRNARVAREKQTAQLRTCDFCTPAVVAQEPVADTVVFAAPELSAAVPIEAMVEAAASQQLEVASEADTHAAPVQPTVVTESAARTRAPRNARGARRTRRAGRPRQVAIASEPSASASVPGLPRLLQSTPRTFTVRYLAEHMVVADSLVDALAQIQAQGATEVFAIRKAD
jgi:hypothetical protein